MQENPYNKSANYFSSGSMEENIKVIVYPAKDLKAGKAFFNTFLGVKPYVEGGYYVGYKVNDLEIGLDPNGHTIIAWLWCKTQSR